jgi:hypothetical protein
MRALNDTLSQADRIGKVPHAKFPAILRSLASANAPILTIPAVAVQHHPADASAGAGERRAEIGGILRDSQTYG